MIDLKRVMIVTLQFCGVCMLIWAAIELHFVLNSQTFAPSMLGKFIPCVSFFVTSGLMHFSGEGMQLISQMDPLTVFFLLITVSIGTVGLFTEDKDRFGQIMAFAVSMLSFVTGFEAGKQRQKLRSPVTASGGTNAIKGLPSGREDRG